MKTKAELLAYIEKHFEDGELIYVPSFMTLATTQESYDWFVDENNQPLTFTNDDFRSIIDIFETIDYPWESMDEGLNDAISAHRSIQAQQAGNI
jgi:hypothetical protein